MAPAMTSASDMSLLGVINANTAPGPEYEREVNDFVTPPNPLVRLIAFYLPQFHPIPENDAWWGKGFTEWANVCKALPRFVGHKQPHLPADLGFYDLRNVEVLREQARLARRYGIHGFCFHHYWFSGRRLLQKPVELLLENLDIDLPFCVNWANENWTRRWDGLDHEVLLAQEHSPQDDIAFAQSLVPLFRDERYIRIDGRPLLMLYRPGLLPNALATVRRWRVECMRAGVGNPYVVMAQCFGENDPRPFGMDAAVEFPPHKIAFEQPAINASLRFLDPDYSGHVIDYAAMAAHAASLPSPPYKLFRGVCPGWDNEARRPGRGFTMAGSSPRKYGTWLEAACRTAMQSERLDERIVFINAWNEWAEGAYLEPDRHYGHAFLAEAGRVLNSLNTTTKASQPLANRGSAVRIALISHDAYQHGAQLVALNIARTLVGDHGVHLQILLGEAGPLEQEFRNIAPTEVVPGNFADQHAWGTAARRLCAAGCTAVLSNTTVAAQAIAPLQAEGLRIVQLVHELPSLINQYKLVAAAQHAANAAEVIVFPSAYVRDRFLEISGPIRGLAVLRHQGLNTPALPEPVRRQHRARIRAELGIEAEQRVILGVGYGDVRKGLDLWSGLIQRVAASSPEVVFVWVGEIDPTLRHWLEHDLLALNLRDRLRLPGRTSELAAYYACADIFALTSREDPFPSVVIEAMANGLPLVLFEGATGLAKLVGEAGGACVAYLDVDAMATEIVRLLRDESSAREMGTSLRRMTDRNFNYVDYGAALLNLAVPTRGPTVSAVVPNFNYARYLRERLASIWAQTYPVQEIILLDDASTDDSPEVIAELERESPVSLRVVRNEVNSGAVARQWARGVALAQGELVWIAEADDTADPHFLDGVVRAFEDPDVALSFCQSRMIDEDGRVVAENYLDYVADIDPRQWLSDYLRAGTEEIAEALAIKNTIPNASAVLFRRESLARVMHDHLDEMAAYRHAADWLCYIRILEQGSVAFTARSLSNHRRHPHSLTVAAANKRHLDEIAAMQAAAAAAIRVSAKVAAAAKRYHIAVARQFGLVLEEERCI
jgi:glycosyltransferase involved in cell wall biosynthesis